MRMREFPPSLSHAGSRRTQTKVPLAVPARGAVSPGCPSVPTPGSSPGGCFSIHRAAKASSAQTGAEVAWHHLPSFSQIQGQRQNSHGYHKTTQNLPKHPVLLQRQSADQPINLLGGASQGSRETHASR